MREARKPHKPSALGVWLARRKPRQWLFPLYASRQLRLETSVLSFPHLPPALSGLRIAYASDIHYGALLDDARVRDLAERLNALQADILLLGGDYGEDAAHTLEFWQAVPPLRARLAVCGVLGNHDRAEADADTLADAMRQRGVVPLVNSALTLEIGAARLAICATDDYNHGAPDFPGTAAQVKGADFVIFAPHSPDALQDAFSLGQPPFFQLALCGHTHGGQISLCGVAPYTASRHGFLYGNRYRSGLLQRNGAAVLVSNGVGTTWMPLRLGAPAQYHLIELKRG